MFKCLKIDMSAKYYELRNMFYKIAPRQSWRVCLIQCRNCVISAVQFERGKVDKKQTYMKNEAFKLFYSLF